jgi:hypothetical protein
MYRSHLKNAGPDPCLDAAMACLIRWIPAWHGFLGSAGAYDPVDPVEDHPVIDPGATTAIRPLWRLRKMRFDKLPLFVGQVHAQSSREFLSIV